MLVVFIEMISTAATLSLTRIVGYVRSLFVPPDFHQRGTSLWRGGKRQTASESEEVVNQGLSFHPTLALHLWPVSRENLVAPKRGAEQARVEKRVDSVKAD